MLRLYRLSPRPTYPGATGGARPLVLQSTLLGVSDLSFCFAMLKRPFLRFQVAYLQYIWCCKAMQGTVAFRLVELAPFERQRGQPVRRSTTGNSNGVC